MKPKPYKDKRKPETKLQEKIIKQLRYYEWIVIPTHGNKYQSGIPDLVAMHVRYPWKFIEVKRDEQFSFTAAQEYWFPKFKRVWIMASEKHYDRLFARPNWHSYLLRTIRHRSKEYTPAEETRSKDKNADDIMWALELLGYDVMHTHGNVYQRGLPDLLCVHPKHGIKWIEVKRPEQYTFTGAQLKYLKYMKMCHFPCWIIQDPGELSKLHEPPNIGDFL